MEQNKETISIPDTQIVLRKINISSMDELNIVDSKLDIGWVLDKIRKAEKTYIPNVLSLQYQ